MYPANGVNVKKKERKLTLIFKHTTANQVWLVVLLRAKNPLSSRFHHHIPFFVFVMQHVAGVEALAVGQDSCLYTASRDSLVKR